MGDYTEMSTFTASNGVILDEYGYLFRTPGDGGKAVHEARKEFYQHLRDKELGQWRSLKDPDFAVRQEKPTEVLVIDEKTGRTKVFQTGEVRTSSGSEPFALAARRFLQRPIPKPEPKPWHSPETGEMWVLTHNGITSAYLYGEGSLFRNDHMPALLPTDSNITDGYRIWPAEAE